MPASAMSTTPVAEELLRGVGLQVDDSAILLHILAFESAGCPAARSFPVMVSATTHCPAEFWRVTKRSPGGPAAAREWPPSCSAMGFCGGSSAASARMTSSVSSGTITSPPTSRRTAYGTASSAHALSTLPPRWGAAQASVTKPSSQTPASSCTATRSPSMKRRCSLVSVGTANTCRMRTSVVALAARRMHSSSSSGGLPMPPSSSSTM
mmetsp:Transcript_29864/g.60224  ORF Transcript_29864/g.60224 Transcript_29864/m.60224 type:complete len:209 (-) Transcript_29864:183-809(-)